MHDAIPLSPAGQAAPPAPPKLPPLVSLPWPVVMKLVEDRAGRRLSARCRRELRKRWRAEHEPFRRPGPGRWVDDMAVASIKRIAAKREREGQ